ncbi:MAG TPA: glycosyltransferase family 1 protein [Acidimicrobiia bacterium]
MQRTTKATRTSRLRIGVHVGQLAQKIPGGIGRVTEMLCDELPKHVDVVAFSSCPRRARRTFDARLGSAVEFRSLGPGAPRWRYELWHRYRRPHIDLDVDVCHAPSLAIPPSSAPLVVTVNDIAFLRHPEAFTPHGVRFHERGLDIARREAAAVIVPSAFTRDELVLEGFDRDRIHCVPLAVRAPDRMASADTCRQLRRRGVRGPYLLVVGTVEPRKDHATLVAAFELVRARRPELTLVVAGASGWLANDAASALARPGVVVLGRVSDAELDLLYRRAEVVLSGSIYEGFGLAVLEALARGRPVVATAIPAHVELVADAARLFAPGDVDALAGEIEALLRDPSARRELHRAALGRANQFDIATTIEGHLGAYECAVVAARRP